MTITRTEVLSVLVGVLFSASCGGPKIEREESSLTTTTTTTGTLPDGSTYLIQVPPSWNGTLLLYSHGFVDPGSANPAAVGGDPATIGFLLQSGFALAGSSFATTGWAVHEALRDQIGVLDVFESTVGHPTRTIAWGHSLGGMITAGLIQRNPHRFDGALPLCGVLAGAVGTWNQALDAAFAFKTLIGAATPLQLVGITNPQANLTLAEGLLAQAQATPQGRARVALVSALGDVPGWFTPTSPEPADDDFATQEANQFQWTAQSGFPLAFAFRADVEARAGGNPSWNVGVDYRRQLERSVDRDEVRGLYAAAGLDLDTDLDALNAAPRIAADHRAVEYLEDNIDFDGELPVPVLATHTKGDGTVVVENESAYRRVVREAGDSKRLRQTFVGRAGHCAFTPAETVTLFQNLIARLDTGAWPPLDVATLNAEAAALGPSLNVFLVGGNVVATPPAFIDLAPGPFLRPFERDRR
jgi:pimeloyl-ACP methyl ester carboxylesterase